MRVLTRRVRQLRLGALFMLSLAAVLIAVGTLLALVLGGDFAFVTPSVAVGATILIGFSLADIRYARHLERRHLERTI